MKAFSNYMRWALALVAALALISLIVYWQIPEFLSRIWWSELGLVFGVSVLQSRYLFGLKPMGDAVTRQRQWVRAYQKIKIFKLLTLLAFVTLYYFFGPKTDLVAFLITFMGYFVVFNFFEIKRFQMHLKQLQDDELQNL